MSTRPIYFDNHATTRVDPRVVEAMLPFLSENYGNAGSTTHAFGHTARQAVDEAREKIAASISARPREIVFTSGSTESNNLALRGVAERHAARGRHLVSVATEHPSVLDPLGRLQARGFEVTLLPVRAATDREAGRVRVEQLAEALRDDTILVSVMAANHEIGAIAPVAEIGRLCHDRGILLHCDATQAVGKMPVDVDALGIDLMSFSGHKIYGPKGVGALYVRSRGPRVKLEPQLDGGGQEHGLRSGTLNVAGIVAMARALELCLEELPEEAMRLRGLRDRLFAGLAATIEGLRLNGPALDRPEWRLPGNLNVSFPFVQGEALLLHLPEVALSSGSACTSATPEPSHVLQALGLDDETIYSSLRFGLGRFNTADEVERVIVQITEAVARLRNLSSVKGVT